MVTTQLVDESTMRSSSYDHYGGTRMHLPSVRVVSMVLRGRYRSTKKSLVQDVASPVQPEVDVAYDNIDL
jgi:hypothetical protein